MERFKKVPKYPDYEISNLGTVVSNKSGLKKINKITFDAKGEPQVCLSKKGVQKNFKIHDLMEKVFGKRIRYQYLLFE